MTSRILWGSKSERVSPCIAFKTFRIRPSASSSLNLWVQSGQFDAGVGRLEMPIHPPLPLVGLPAPGRKLLLQLLQLPNPPPMQTLTNQGADLTLRHIQPTPMLRCINNLQPLHVSPRHLRLKHLIKRPPGVAIEIVHHQRHLDTLDIPRVQQVGHLPGPVLLPPLQPRRRLPKTCQRLAKHKNARRPIPLILIVHPRRMFHSRRNGTSRLLHQLHRLFIHTHHRILGIIRPRINLQDLLHGRHKLRILLRRNHPVPHRTSPDAVFLASCGSCPDVSTSQSPIPPTDPPADATSSRHVALVATSNSRQSAWPFFHHFTIHFPSRGRGFPFLAIESYFQNPLYKGVFAHSRLFAPGVGRPRQSIRPFRLGHRHLPLAEYSPGEPSARVL